MPNLPPYVVVVHNTRSDLDHAYAPRLYRFDNEDQAERFYQDAQAEAARLHDPIHVYRPDLTQLSTLHHLIRSTEQGQAEPTWSYQPPEQPETPEQAAEKVRTYLDDPPVFPVPMTGTLAVQEAAHLLLDSGEIDPELAAAAYRHPAAPRARREPDA